MPQIFVYTWVGCAGTEKVANRRRTASQRKDGGWSKVFLGVKVLLRRCTCDWDCHCFLRISFKTGYHQAWWKLIFLGELWHRQWDGIEDFLKRSRLLPVDQQNGSSIDKWQIPKMHGDTGKRSSSSSFCFLTRAFECWSIYYLNIFVCIICLQYV